MTDATAVPVNVFENDRELMVVAPMPGVARATRFVIPKPQPGRRSSSAHVTGSGTSPDS